MSDALAAATADAIDRLVPGGTTILVAVSGGPDSLALASATAMVVLEHLGASRSRLYYGTDTRASAVMVGAALAALRVVAGRERWIRWRATGGVTWPA